MSLILTCTDSAGLTYGHHSASGHYTVPAAPVDVTCTFVNTRTSATMILQKTWVDAAAGDTADLSISGSDPGSADSATATASGAAGSETDTVNRAVAPIFSGETVSLVEDLGATNTGSYAGQIDCLPAGGLTRGEDGQGGAYQVPTIPVSVICTFTNTRTSATMTLQKDWVNGASGDTAALSINGATSGSGFAIATVPASGSGLATDKATFALLSGSRVTVAEMLGAANTGSYTSQFTCSPADGLTASGDGRAGTYQVPTIPVPVICTFTNTGSTPVGPFVPPPTPTTPGSSANGPTSGSQGSAGAGAEDQNGLAADTANGEASELAFTGNALAQILVVALALLGLGAVLVYLGRSRRKHT